MGVLGACLLLHLALVPSATGMKLFEEKNLRVKFEFDRGHNAFDITAEGEYLANSSGNRKRSTHGFRPGHSTTTNTCDQVRGVPDELRQPIIMRPDGLANFYQKYTETYGIPILGSSQVSDDALKRACYTVRFMLADHAGIRESYYKLSGRVAIMAATEVTKDIPEHSHLDDYMNNRTRGLGASVTAPVSTGAEENVLCQTGDRYHPEDIMIHEFAHAIDSLGASIVIPDWNQKLKDVYNHANSTGLWANTYAMTNPAEYFYADLNDRFERCICPTVEGGRADAYFRSNANFHKMSENTPAQAEGVQSYFNVNDHANPTNGIHNDIDTRAELRNYDRQLYDLIQTIFPCNNHYLKRCDSTRQQEESQHLRMDCNTDNAVFPDFLDTSPCQDEIVECLNWAATGECDANPRYMLVHCRASCHVCTQDPASSQDCTDEHASCPEWAASGECHVNPGYMLISCRHSCDTCDSTTFQHGTPTCSDSHANCLGWAAKGECESNPGYMLNNCRYSCDVCDGSSLIGR